MTRSYLYIGDYNYLKRIEELLNAGKNELEVSENGKNQEKLAQAGEKVHGAINNLVYLLKKREYGDHEWIRQQIREITFVDKRTKDRIIEINDTLHANFYHRFLDYGTVNNMINDAIHVVNSILEKYNNVR